MGNTGKCKETGRSEKGEEMSTVDMNPAAIQRYEKRGGKDLLGKSLLDCHNEKRFV